MLHKNLQVSLSQQWIKAKAFPSHQSQDHRRHYSLGPAPTAAVSHPGCHSEGSGASCTKIAPTQESLHHFEEAI